MTECCWDQEGISSLRAHIQAHSQGFATVYRLIAIDDSKGVKWRHFHESCKPGPPRHVCCMTACRWDQGGMSSMRANIQARCQGYRGGGGGRARGRRMRWEGRTVARNTKGSREKRNQRVGKQGRSRGGRRRENERRVRIGNEKTGRNVARNDYVRLVVLINMKTAHRKRQISSNLSCFKSIR